MLDVWNLVVCLENGFEYGMGQGILFHLYLIALNY